MKSSQNKAPIYEALKKHRLNRVVPFDVPSHKGGRGNSELTDFLGINCMKADVNSMKPLDNLCHPKSIIRDAEKLAAEAFGANHVFFMVNGTTSAVQAMIMSVCKANEKIILPRNVHRSVINTLVLNGAEPVFINPGINKDLGIALGMQVSEVEKAIKENPDAKAVFVNNPSYYGICADLAGITKLARSYGLKTLVDEAHGTHFYFGDNMPITAMEAGADMASVSMHKTGGSLTQSSFLLCGKDMDSSYVRQIINLTQTTSASYLLLSSLDLARKYVYLNGKEMFKKTLEYAEYARKEINKIGGYWAFSDDIVDGGAVYNFDKTKLSIHTRAMGLAGVEVYDLLRDEYDIQIEFGDLGNILAIISSADRELELERLIAALSEIKRLYGKEPMDLFDYDYINPITVISPQKAFYSNKKIMPLKESGGKVSAEFVMSYPPGIPILAPGELITEDVIDYILYSKEKGCLITGPQDMEIENINVVEE